MPEAFAEIGIEDGEARALVSPAHAAALCAGHFPDDPLLPGAYLVELMADLGARLVTPGGDAPPRPPEIRRCAFATRVRPTHAIRLRARLEPRDVVEVELTADGARAASATLAFGTRR